MKPSEKSGSRKPYEAPSLQRVVVDPVKEMLTVCTASPGKTSPAQGCNGTGS